MDKIRENRLRWYRACYEERGIGSRNNGNARERVDVEKDNKRFEKEVAVAAYEYKWYEYGRYMWGWRQWCQVEVVA